MPRNTTLEMKRGSARTERTDPRRDTLEVKQSTAKKTARDQYIGSDSRDQLARVAGVHEIAAALASLSAEDQVRAVALANVEVVRRSAHRDLKPKEAAGRAGCSTATILRWIAQYGIGRRVGGRYVVVAALLDALLAGDAR